MTSVAPMRWLSDSHSSSQDSLPFGPSEDDSDHGGDVARKSSKGSLCHPYVHSTGAEVNIFNCVAIFMAYCKALLGEEFNCTQLFEFHRPPGQQVDQLHTICYPAPEGKVFVTAKEVDAAWGGKGLADVVHRRQIAGLREIDRQKIHFVYPVVLDMIRRGLLDEYNKPAYATGLGPPASRLATPLPLPAVPPAAAPAQRPRSRPAAKKEGSKWPQNKDPKSLLNELKHQMGMELIYETLPAWPQGETPRFQSVLQVKWQQETYVFRGSPANSKKAAEQSVAVPAVDFILSGGLEFAPLSTATQPSAAPKPLPAPTVGPVVAQCTPGKIASASKPLSDPRGAAPPPAPLLRPADWLAPAVNLAALQPRPAGPPLSVANWPLGPPGDKEPPHAISVPSDREFHGEAVVYLMPSRSASSWPASPPAPAVGIVGDVLAPRGPAATLTKGWQLATAWFTAQNLISPVQAEE